VRQLIGEAAILRPQLSSRHFNYRRHEAPSELSDFVENLWTVTWELPAGNSYTAEVLPYPSVNLSVTNTEADVTGLVRCRYDRRLIGRGFAIGVRFRPACFRPFIGWPVSQLTDRHRPIADVLGRPTVELRQRIEREENQVRRADILTAFLLEDLPPRDETALLLADMVSRIGNDRGITRVSQVAALAQMSVRSLQRVFGDYVGAGPKWVIQRFRLQDAARAAASESVDWSSLAVELGFADQTHLTRAFTAAIGAPPATYARQAQAD
jgi:AraC-like DNA-binding protein